MTIPASLRGLVGIILVLMATQTQSGCRADREAYSPDNTLTIFAAASLNEVFTEIGKGFEAAHPGTEAVFNFAGSQQLAQQLAQGAPADVLASANPKQMLAVVKQGRIAPQAPRPFAGNRLVVVLPADNPAGIESLGDLALPGVRLLLADASVPAGQYSLEWLEKVAVDPAYGERFRRDVLRNAVSYEENVRAVLSKVLLGEADAGFVYNTDVKNLKPGSVRVIEIPEKLNVETEYLIAVIADSRQPELAQTFVAYVRSSEGQAILARHGFSTGQ